MTSPSIVRRGWVLEGSFRQALTWAGVLLLAAICAMAVAMGLGLRRADHLLDRLSQSQMQLVRVTRIEADLNALLVHLAVDEPNSGREAAAAADRIEAELREYLLSIDTEGRRLAGTPGAADHQRQEALNAQALSRLFVDLRDELLAGNGALTPQVELKRRRFYALAGRVAAGERAEAAQAAAAMRDLRDAVTGLGAGIAVLVGLTGAVCAWIMVGSMIRPLRALEAATERAGRGGRAAPVDVRGFSEFRRLGQAFNRMDEQIAAQRLALSDVNRGLEGQIVERTAEIEASRARLAEVDRTRRLFFSRVSHELRTPVTVIRGEAEVALRDPAAPARRLRASLEHVVANGQFLQRRLDDLLAVARAEDGRVTLAREPVDLGAIVRQAVAVAEPFARSSGIGMKAVLPNGPGPATLGDPSWLQQALLALIDNAVKFAPDSREIEVALRVEGDSARIAVADGGAGVDPAELTALFESYYQVPGRPTNGGSGLGLSVARWVAEQHGGSITAENRFEQGLVIEIRLPSA
jgi:signal transduction histidine kinase